MADVIIRGLILLTVVMGAEFAENNAGLVRPGRHVCSTEESYQASVPRTTPFCRPVYKSYLRLCEGYRICKSFRVVYERAYQTVYQMETKTRKVLKCCPGWAQVSPTDNGCLKPICDQGCTNNGQCIKPNKCKCPRGWNGPTCKDDLNECKNGRHDCQQLCKNTNGSYTCACHEGFQLGEDKKTCKLCLTCLPEYDNMAKGYKELMYRVNSLEKEKDALMGNLSTLQNDMHHMDEQIHTYMKSKPTPGTKKPTTTTQRPTTTTEDYYQDPQFIPFDRLASLSEQISILEERLEDCSCKQGQDNEDRDLWSNF
ncbi:epidermal growth factor-like protein 7 [Liolophura sinensis]|uniref:epidermal growth factor-like protein 7 n=1 Tax=Liolophura sinensis TaxID=3198878 RepID=UPI003158B7AB